MMLLLFEYKITYISSIYGPKAAACQYFDKLNMTLRCQAESFGGVILHSN